MVGVLLEKNPMKSSSGKVRKRKSTQTKRRKLRGTVMKMLAVMESNPETMKDPVSEFLVTGRTGRRNAMADILGPNASVTSGDLPKRLESLTTMDSEAGPSAMPQPSDSNQQVPVCDGSKSSKPVEESLTKVKSDVNS